MDKDRLDFIIRAFLKINKNFIFNIYGLTFDEYCHIFNVEKKEASDIQKNTRIVFHGRVDHDTVLKALYDSHYMVIIRNRSRKNDAGFPTKFVESICSGVPVIANDYSDLSLYYKNEVGILIDNLDCTYNGLSKAINLPYCEYVNMKTNCLNCEDFWYENHSYRLGMYLSKIINEKN